MIFFGSFFIFFTDNTTIQDRDGKEMEKKLLGYFMLGIDATKTNISIVIFPLREYIETY